MSKAVIDVSKHQVVIDWEQVYGNVDGAIIRCGYGNNVPAQDDKQFNRNVEECVRLGIPFGIYFYSYATNDVQIESEVNHFLRLASPYKDKMTYPAYLDLEEPGTENGCVERAKIWVNRVREAGFEVGIYANEYWFHNYIKNGLDGLTKWVAKYGENNGQKNTAPVVDGMDAWQYTSRYIVPGINGGVDMSEFYKEFVKEQPVKNESVPEARQHKVGEIVSVSSYYNSSTDPIEKAIYRNHDNLVIGRVLDTDVHNPYRLDRNGVAIGWCNDGDIRSVGAVTRKTNEEVAAEIFHEQGGWGTGDERKRKLEEQGYDWSVIQNLVSSMMNKSNVQQTQAKYVSVRSGETMSSIARTNGISLDELKKLNPQISDYNKIFVGQKIRVK